MDIKSYICKALFFLFTIIFLISVFKNISYPLFWADESMTVMGSERILEYGYPKINDGKNVIYDLRHSNKRLGANETLDAYVGGAGWLQYYYGAIATFVASQFQDFYLKTAIIRSWYALAGLFGLFILMQWVSSLIPEEKNKINFKIAFIFLCISSISLTLHIREARYYALVFPILYGMTVLYLKFRVTENLNLKKFISIYVLLHLLSIITFSPVYFIIIASVGIMESLFFISSVRKQGFTNALNNAKPIIMATLLSGILAIPVFTFFKTFEINRIMSEFNGYNADMYWNNFKTAIQYLTKFEYLYVAVIVKILTLIFLKPIIRFNSQLIKVSTFYTILTIVFVFAISRMHGFMYTRYIVYLQPLISLIILADGYLLYKILADKYSKNIAVPALLILFGMIGYKVYENRALLQGHIYEMTHQYKGPLDETINYIKDNFENPSKLVVATNYEETSFMYYLNTKTIIGYVENNLAEDLKFKPDIIAYRPNWGDPNGIFANYIKDNEYFVKRFTLKNLPVNTISEFNYLPNFTHKFRTETTYTYNESVQLWILNKYDQSGN